MYRYIYGLKRDGKLVISSEDSRLELAEESLDESIEDDIEEPTEGEEEKSVSKIQTLDVVNMAMNKFDQYMQDCGVAWDSFVNNGRITNTPNFAFVDDLYNILNKTLDEKVITSVAVFNKLFENMTDSTFSRNLALYGREKYGKPFLAEGLTLLLYELSVDWAVFLSRYFKELPELKNESDSFFKKFRNLELLTYTAELFNNSTEFGSLINNDKARNLILDEGKYKLTTEQAKKKPGLYRARGESLSYYASLVRYNYADIMVGAIDKLGVVAFLAGKCQNELHERLGIIRDLIQTVVSKNTPAANTSNVPTLDATLRTLEIKATDILKMRSEARIILESNEKNFPMVL